ncbi:MAG: cation:proton antiporter [Candidatus Diapherotrites archaeon]|nr:cation:proton antiporter [Candidatus Diapherotrites archaeon]
MEFLSVLLLVFSLALLLGKIANRLSLPRVAGYLLAGILLTLPPVSSLLPVSAYGTILEPIANIGIVLMFFFAGLKISIPSFRRNLNESILISGLNTFLPFLAVGAFMLWSGYALPAAIIMGITLAVSGQAIVVEIMDELNLLKTKAGNLLLNAGSVDDVVELLLLTSGFFFMGNLASQNPFQLVGNLALFAVIILLTKIFLLSPIFRIFTEKSSKESLFGGALATALFMAVLSNFLGLGAIIGAMVAGMLVRQFFNLEERKPWEQNLIAHQIHLIGFGFFIPVFFVWVGLQTNLQSIATNPFLLLVLFFTSTILGFIGTWLGVRFSHGNPTEATFTALGMSAKGDTELAVGAIALSLGIISTELFSIIVIIAFISAVFPPMLFYRFAQKNLSTLSTPAGR